MEDYDAGYDQDDDDVSEDDLDIDLDGEDRTAPGGDDDTDIPPHLQGLPRTKLAKYNKEMDLLYPEVLEREMNEYLPPTRLLTSPINCLEVCSGFISNIRIHERELVERATPNADTPVFNSNFGRKMYEHYMHPVPPPKTNRGRKPKKTATKQRKRQGNGNDMASQASIHVRSRVSELAHGYIISPDALMYKMKVFCTGDVQVPNASQVDLNDMLICTRDVLVGELNKMIHGGEPVSKLLYMVPTLKNYKMNINLPKDYVIDLTYLKRLLLDVQAAECGLGSPGLLRKPLSSAPAHPSILHVIYTRKDSNLAVLFSTPTPQLPDKKLRFNIYIDGRVTILGGLYMSMTSAIYYFIDWIMETNYHQLIAKIAEYPEVMNVAQHTVEECVQMYYDSVRRRIQAACDKVGASAAVTEMMMDIHGANDKKYISDRDAPAHRPNNEFLAPWEDV